MNDINNSEINKIDKIDKYFNNPAISQSDLIALSKSPYIFKQKKDNKNDYTSDSLTLGSAVDCLLTDKENWENRFYVSTVSKPTGQMLEYTEKLFNLCNSSNIDIPYTSEIEKSVYDTIGFKRDSFIKVQERFKEEGLEYYNELKRSIEKTYISFKMYEQAKEIENVLRTSQYSKKYFIPETAESIYFQTPIYFEHNLVKCKALIDIIKVDYKNRTIIPIDIKTTEFLPNFKDSVWKYRYDLQAAWYMLAISYLQKETLSTFSLLPFVFLVAEKCCGHKPWVFKVSKDTLSVGTDGGLINSKRYKGYNKLLNEYKICKTEENWNYPVELLEGEIEI